MWRWLGKKANHKLESETLEDALDEIFVLSQKGQTYHLLTNKKLEPRVQNWQQVGQRLERLILHENAAYGFYLLKRTGLLKTVLPELAQNQGVSQGGFHHLDVLDHLLETLRQVILYQPDASLALRWASLLHDVGKGPSKASNELGQLSFLGHDTLGAELAGKMLERLVMSQAQTLQAQQLVRYHMLPLPKNRKEAERFVRRRGTLLPDLLYLMIADREAARGPLSSEASRRAYRLALARVIEVQETPTTARQSLLTGHEVMHILKLEPGPLVAKALTFLEQSRAAGDIRTQEEAQKALWHYALQQGWIKG